MNGRRTRRIARLAAAVCLVTSGFVALAPAPSSAEGFEATGWWSRTLPLQGDVEGQSTRSAVRFTPAQELPPTVPAPGSDEPSSPVTTLPLPVPVPTVPEPPVTLPDDPGPGTPNPTVPEGGLWVANDPTGPIAMSAIRYRGDVGSAELTLRFAPGSTNVGPVVACPTLSEFTPGAAQPWRDRPAHDCERMSVTGRRSTDGTAMQFSIPQGFMEFGERLLDIVILPSPTAGDPFSIYFLPPGEDSLEVLSGQELPPPVEELPDPDPATLPTFEEAPVDDFAFSDTPLDLPADEPAAPEEEPTVDQSASPPSPIAQVLEPFTESRTARIISVLLLLGMGAALWFFGGQPVRHPRLLGALAGDAPVRVDAPESLAGRGIGRFQRPRAGPPQRL